MPTLSPAFDVRALTKQIIDVLTVEDRLLGANGTCARVVTRLPHRLWWDVAPGGALFHALKVYLEYKRDGKLRDGGVSEYGRHEFCEFIERVRQEFLALRLMKFVKIHIPDDVEDAEALRRLAREMHAVLALTPNEEGVTHVLKSDDSDDKAADEAAYWRIAQTGTAETSSAKPEHRLHFWFYPDSYDTWYADSSITGKGKAPWPKSASKFVSGEAVRTVRARWLRDSYKFNEWMNDYDYEFDTVASAPTSPWEGDVEYGDGSFVFDASGPNVSPDAEMLAPSGTDRLAYDVTRRRVTRVHPIVLAAAVQDDGAIIQQDEVSKEVFLAKSLKWENLSAGQLPRHAMPARANDAQPTTSLTEYRVPTHSAWFAWDSAHDIEKAAMPEFFQVEPEDDTHTPEKYIQYRNAMMHAFRDAGREITAEEARRTLKGNEASLARIFRFLERWGLVNWRFALEQDVMKLKYRPLPSIPSITCGNDGGAPEVCTLPTIDALKAPLFEFEKVKSTTPTGAHALSPFDDGSSAEIVYERRTLDKLFATHKALHEGGATIDFGCNMCGVDLTKGVFYHCVEVNNFDLCTRCYPLGIYPQGKVSGDFVKALYPSFKTIAVDNDEEQWTDAEVLSLLEGIDQYDEDWGSIAENVGSKSADECLKYFLKMPIDDDIIATMDQAMRVPSGSKIGNVGAELPDPSSIPFADAPNPVMAQLAFLTTMLSPRVAAASAKAALNELTSSGPGDVSAERVQAAAGVGLAAAAVEAKLLAQDEEHEINRLMSGVIDLQTRKLDLKMQRLSCIDEVLVHEQSFFGISRRGAHASRLQVLAQKQQDSERLPKLQARLAELKVQVGQEL